MPPAGVHCANPFFLTCLVHVSLLCTLPQALSQLDGVVELVRAAADAAAARSALQSKHGLSEAQVR